MLMAGGAGMTDALDAYRVAQQRRGLSPETIRRRKYTYWKFERWLGRDITTASTDEIERFLDSLDLAPRARYCYISNLHTFYEFCVRESHMATDPTVRIDRPKLPRNVPRPISRNDLEVALGQAEPRLRAMIALGAFEGLRCKEIAGLTRDDVMEHEEPPLLLVRFGKGGKERVLPLNEYTEVALRSYGMPKRGALFQRDDGKALAPYTVGRLIADYLHSLGIEASAHQLRHHFASAVYRETSDLRMVQELLGHSSPTTTAVYAQWNPAKAADVVRRLGAGSRNQQQSML